MMAKTTTTTHVRIAVAKVIILQNAATRTTGAIHAVKLDT